MSISWQWKITANNRGFQSTFKGFAFTNKVNEKSVWIETITEIKKGTATISKQGSLTIFNKIDGRRILTKVMRKARTWSRNGS